jgi:hypothetical protein
MINNRIKRHTKGRDIEVLCLVEETEAKILNYADKYTYKRPFQSRSVHVYWLYESERIYWSST